MATANPCIKLSIQLANRLRYPVIFFESSFVENWNIFSINEKVIIPTIIQSPVWIGLESEKQNHESVNCLIISLDP